MGANSLTVYRAAALVGADGRTFRPAALVTRDAAPVWAGPADQVPAEFRESAELIDLGQALLLPRMVNAHTHLELSDIGPLAYPGNFIGWMVMVREHWPDWTAHEPAEYARGFARSAGHGAAASLRAGVYAVGDISRFPEVAKARRHAGLAGVTFEEIFGLGSPWDEPGRKAIAHAARGAGAEGLQPHAPYSAGPRLYEAASRSGLPLSTHLAEMGEELRFVAQASGPWLKFLRGIQKWDDRFAADYGQGLTPVQWIAPFLEQAAEHGRPWLLAHCNYVTDRDIDLLAQTRSSVAYCPRASAYFGHPLPNVSETFQPPQGAAHRYQEMLHRGVNVCLGTDSIVCQPPDEPQPMSILAQMRTLYRRDRTEPKTLLRMATKNGEQALALTEPGNPAHGGYFSVQIDRNEKADPLTQALNNNAPATALPEPATQA